MLRIHASKSNKEKRNGKHNRQTENIRKNCHAFLPSFPFLFSRFESIIFMSRENAAR